MVAKMGKDQFVTDLYMASDDDRLDGVYVVGDGETEGEFLFQYYALNGDPPMMISALIVGMEVYPSSHECFVFGVGDDSTKVGEKLGDLPSLTGRSIHQILTTVSRHLRNKESDGSANRPFIINDDVVMQDISTVDLTNPTSTERRSGPMILDDQEDIYASIMKQAKDKGPAKPISPKYPTNKLAVDLRTVKDAGFRLGYHGNLKGSGCCYVVVTCRLSKLGISDNALDAWKVDQKRYLSLIIEYPQGYVSLGDLLNNKKSVRKMKSTNIRMRIRQGDKYKPSLKECQQAFKNGDSGKDMPYILKTLELFLNERLMTLIRKRVELGFSWYGAEEYYFTEKDNAGKSMEAMEAKYWHDDNNAVLFSRLVTSDHFNDSLNSENCSFPLLAMQFFLRHFARYTDFCLVCHRSVKSDVEALEPYVCSTPTCLSKYLSSDFGPGIERDIVEQPYVVDLLVSFCYASAKHQKLTSFPDALNLKVPFPSSTANAGYQGTYDHSTKELTLRIAATTPICHPVQIGTWMAISGAGIVGEVLCCRAVDMSNFPIIKVSDPISTTSQANATNIGNAFSTAPTVRAGSLQVTVNLYSQDFAAFNAQQKQETICLLLDTLPTVREMKDRLREGHLASWGDRISPAALGVLRWVVASNRSCIVQVDGLESGSQGVFPATHTEDRVYGMGNWMQFRFAMGAPDKEQKFQQATSTVSGRLRGKHPTMFAWHGSPLMNWHSIIREGLNFNQTLNGRAYGNGVYHSLDFRTSLGYTGGRHAIAGSNQWSKSVLKVSAAVALNEIVNAPGEFVSRTPHLVIDKLDWIHTRYLFVQCAFSNLGTASQKRPAQIKAQDPSMTPNGEQGQLIIPKPKPTRARKEDQLAADKKQQSDTEFYIVQIDGIEERIPKGDDNPSDGTNSSDLDVFLGEDADSLDIDDMDVAIAMSIEESSQGSYGFAPPTARNKKGGLFSGFRGFGRADTIKTENVRPNSTVSSDSRPSSFIQPPGYEDVPMNTPPGYTTLSESSGFFDNTNNTNVPAPGYTSRTNSFATASSSSINSPSSFQTRTPSSSSSVSSRGSSFFGGFRKAVSNIGNTSNTNTEPWSNAFTGVPISNAVSNPVAASPTVGKGKAPAKPLVSAPQLANFDLTSFLSGINPAATNVQKPTVTTAVPSVATASNATTLAVPKPSTSILLTSSTLTVPKPSTTVLPTTPAAATTTSSLAVPKPAVPVAPAVAPTPSLAVPKASITAGPVTRARAAAAVATTTPAPAAAPQPAPEPPKVPLTDFVAGELDYSTLPLIAQPTFATHAATKRLQKEYKNLLKIQDSTPLHELGWYTNPDHFDNVYQWIVELHTFDSALPLAQDMKARKVKSIVLEMRFGASFPTTPPFVRVIRPKFLPFMNGGGGHVTIGGAICLEMLTGTGWDSKTTIESILVNIRLAMMSQDPKPARLEGLATATTISSYGQHEAVEAYLRACRSHGWQVPKGFEQMARSTT